MDSGQIATSLIFLMLLPLGIGLFIRPRYQALAASLQPTAAQISTVAIAFLMIALLVVNFEQIIDTIGTGGIAAALIVPVGAFVVGFVVGGNPEEQRSVLGRDSPAAEAVVAATPDA